jgi:importin subunit beta-1
MSLAPILLAATTSDIKIRQPAEKQLADAEANNFPLYFVALCKELGNEQLQAPARQLAGLQLKNCMDAKSENLQAQKNARYLALDASARATVKTMVVQILGSSLKEARSTAALVIGKIAAIEIPANTWNELLAQLMANIASEQAAVRQSSFEALGYVCEECPGAPLLLQASGNILQAIAHGLRAEEKDEGVKMAAITCLTNALEFVKTNFEDPTQRNIIMQMVFAAASAPEKSIKESAYQCLVAIAARYYQHLNDYMGTIHGMTSFAIQQDDDDLARQGIEFWSTVCETELEIAIELEECQELKTQPTRQSLGLMARALSTITPLLLQSLTKQSDELDDETDNAAKAAAFCIGLVSENVSDAIVDIVLPFVHNNIRNPNWRFREAAVLAFGYMLDGPDRIKMTPVVQGAFSVLLEHMADENDLIKDTTAWTLGRVCEYYAGEVVNEVTLPQLIQVFRSGLTEHPSIAKNVAWAINNLAAEVSLSPGATTSPLSCYFKDLVTELLALTAQVDEPKLVDNAFTAITKLVENSAPDSLPLLALLYPNLLQRLAGTFTASSTTVGATIQAQVQVQGLMCGLLQVLLRKTPPQAVQPYADNMMNLLLNIFRNPMKSESALEEAMHCVGSVADCLGASFEPYLNAFMPYVLEGLKNPTDHHLCSNSIVALQSIAYAVKDKISPAGDDLIRTLLANLQNASVDRTIKPTIISCIADLAYTFGLYFERYLGSIMEMLNQASAITVKTNFVDSEEWEWTNSLRESILDCYSCILGALCPLNGQANLGERFLPFLQQIYTFLEAIASDGNRIETVLKKAVALIFDLAKDLRGPHIQNMLRAPCIPHLIECASKIPALLEIAQDADSETKVCLAR